MKSAAISEVKAKFAQYLRLVKAGETVEIRERGVPIAVLTAIPQAEGALGILPPRRDPKLLAKMTFTVKPKKRFDIVALLMEDRRRR